MSIQPVGELFVAIKGDVADLARQVQTDVEAVGRKASEAAAAAGARVGKQAAAGSARQAAQTVQSAVTDTAVDSARTMGAEIGKAAGQAAAEAAEDAVKAAGDAVVAKEKKSLKQRLTTPLVGKPAKGAGTADAAVAGAGMAGAGAKLAGLAGGALAGAAVLTYLKDAGTAASDMNETASKTQTIFGAATDTVNQFAAGSAASLGQSKQAALDAAATFGVFGKAGGLAGQDLASFSTDLVGLSSDLASFYNEDPSAAAEAIGAAFRGEAEPLRRFGVLLSADAISAQALSMGLVQAKVDTTAVAAAQMKVKEASKAAADAQKKYGEGSDEAAKAQIGLELANKSLTKAMGGTKVPLTQNQKLLATQALIMEQTGVAQGDFAKTSEGLANQQRIAAAEAADNKQELGKGLLPVMLALTKVARPLGKIIFPAIGAALNLLAPPITWLAEGLGSLVTWMSENKVVAGILIGAMAAIALGMSAAAIATAVATGAVTAFGAVMAVVTAPITLIVLAIAAIGIALYLLWKRSETFQKIVRAVFEKVQAVFVAVWDVAKKVFNGIKVVIAVALAVILTYARTWWRVFSAVFDKVKDIVGIVVRAFTGVFNAVKEWLGKVVAWVKDTWVGRLLGSFTNLITKMKTIGGDVVRGIWDGIKGMGSWLKEKVMGWVKDTLPGPIAKVLGITSPSKVAAGLGRYFVQGLYNGLDSGSGSIQNLVEGLVPTDLPTLQIQTDLILPDSIDPMQMKVAAAGSLSVDAKATLPADVAPRQVTFETHLHGIPSNDEMVRRTPVEIRKAAFLAGVTA